jgi:hypothetical protein
MGSIMGSQKIIGLDYGSNISARDRVVTSQFHFIALSFEIILAKKMHIKEENQK